MTSGPTPATPSTDPTAYRLSGTIRPAAYRLELAPDLDNGTFTGRVAIDLTAEESSAVITLNAVDLVIEAARLTVDGSDSPVEASAITLDNEEERATIELPGPFVGGAVLELEFTGVLNDLLRGFYRSTFTDAEGVERTIATTQMESTDARRAFPCFDEPEFKATFEISLIVADGLAAYSNSALVDETPLGDGTRRVRFAPTMVMSTYLVAMVVGPLEHTEPVDVDGTPLRIVFPRGKGHLTEFALEVGAHALRFFQEYFSIPYPAGKLDMVAIPDFAFGAMENVGCVTYRESLLLVDPAAASRLELERVADVVCHEIAHMWFGNLVTMKWWNGIWLNEAFATMMEILATDAFRPQWERWVSFGVEKEAAMAVDGLASTRPVEFPVGRPEEAEGMFDVLTYQKGGSVLRMLEQFIGPDTFRAGIHDYLTEHAYANTETADLWDALERASGRDVRSIMGTFIDQGGFPLVTVADDGSMTQQPFSYADPAGGAIGSNWQIPVLYRTLGNDGVEPALIDGPAVTGATADPADLVVNAGGSGYYRVAYTSAHLARLAARQSELTALERYNLVSDTWAATLAGHRPVEDFLALARTLRDGGDRDPSVWSVILGALSLAERVIPEGDQDILAAGIRALLQPLADELGWTASDGEGERTPSLRAGVLRMLGTSGADPSVRAEAARRFAESGHVPLDADMASTVLDIVAATADGDVYDVMVQRYRSAATPQEEDRYLFALASFTGHDMAQRTFSMAMGEVRTQDGPFLIQRLLTNRAVGHTAWAEVEGAWDAMSERFPPHLLPRMLDGAKVLCSSPELADRVTTFIVGHPMSAGARTIEQTLERLAVNVAFGRREGSRLAECLTQATGDAP